MNQTHHSINYIEFSVTNMERSKQFYSTAFDWKFTDYAPVYAGIQQEGGGEAGGLTVVDKVTVGGPLIVLYSKDLEASLESVKKAEGRITKEIFEFPGGKRFEFSDPDGNQLAVWSEL